jgi:large subunit ribosomal protein L15
MILLSQNPGKILRQFLARIISEIQFEASTAPDNFEIASPSTSTMPPRLQLRLAQSPLPAASALIPTFLVPFLHQQSRNASILASLSDTPGAYNRKIRRGRGPSSGKGKTSGRGHKGQKQHGKVPHQFQGGQTPDEVVRGKEGFKNLYVL